MGRIGPYGISSSSFRSECTRALIEKHQSVPCVQKVREQELEDDTPEEVKNLFDKEKKLKSENPEKAAEVWLKALKRKKELQEIDEEDDDWEDEDDWI